MSRAKMRLTVALAPIFLAAVAALVRPAYADFNSAIAAYAQGDFTSAFRDFLELAKQRDIMAQDIVAIMYHRGTGVPKDDVQAYMWLDLAAHAGDPDAAKFRDEMIAPDMTPADMGKARELAKSSPLYQEGAPGPLAGSPHRDAESPAEPPAPPQAEQLAMAQVEKTPSSEATPPSSSNPAASANLLATRDLPSRAPAQRSAGHHWTIQVVAVQGKPEAEREWKRLRHRYPDLLRGLTPTVEPAGADAKHGSYYRVRIGAWKDKQAPDALCGKLKQRGERCLVLQRLS